MTDSVLAFKDKQLSKSKDYLRGIPEKPLVIPTGAKFIDMVLGGGIPLGRVTEIQGETMSGKTTLALMAAARAQKSGMHVVFMDFERTFDADYYSNVGLDLSPDKLEVLRPATAEEGLRNFNSLVNEKSPVSYFFIIDSVAAMIPEVDLKAGRPMSHPKAVADWVRMTSSRAYQFNTAVVFINHLRSVISGTPTWGGPRKKSSGGDVLPQLATIQLRLTAVELVKKKTILANGGEDNKAIAAFIKGKCLKNKIIAPHGTGFFSIFMGRGHWPEYTAVKVASENKNSLMTKSGSIYKFKPAPNGEWEEQVCPGLWKAVAYLQENLKLRIALEKELLQLMNERANGLIEDDVVEEPPTEEDNDE